MSRKWDGIRCKSYSFSGVEGGLLVLAETNDRRAINVSIVDGLQTVMAVQITAEQFEALCNLNSAYDGLECRAVAPEPPALSDEPLEQAIGPPDPLF
jgi:hypothetical protein